MEEEDAEFHTPPEHQALSHLSSSEDQDPPGFSAEKPPAMAIAGDEFGSETVSLGETETEGNECFLDGKAGAIGTVGEIGGLLNNGEAELDAINGNRELRGKIENVEDIVGEKKPNETGDSSGGLESPKIVGDKSYRLRIRGFEKGVEIAKNADEITKDAEMQKDGHGNEGVKSSSERIKEKSGKRSKKKKITEDAEMQKDGRRNEGMRSSGKRSKKRNKMQEDGHGNEGGRSSGKKMVEIEEFRYVGDDDGKRRKLPPCLKGREMEAGESLEKENGLPPSLDGKEKDLVEVNEDMGKSSKKKSGLPSSMEGKEKDLGESSEKKSEWQEFLDLLKRVKPFHENKDRGNEDEDVDYIQAAKDRGMNFVEPRIWNRLRRD